MTSALDAIAIANRQALALLDARERLLSEDEKRHTNALTAIENARREIALDRESIEKAQEAYARAFRNGASQPREIEPFDPQKNYDATSAPLGATLQSRARIGPQRYAMLATLRMQSMTVEDLAAATKLDVGRVREQMRADSPAYVDEILYFHVALSQKTGVPVHTPQKRLRLTKAATDLLDRFEAYRRAQGKPLPSLTPGDAESSDEDQEDPADVTARSSS